MSAMGGETLFIKGFGITFASDAGVPRFGGDRESPKLDLLVIPSDELLQNRIAMHRRILRALYEIERHRGIAI
jgi:hypothetical protein